jgi:predicted nucleic acid-binding protein
MRTAAPEGLGCDPKDDNFLQLALSGCAPHIVTGDADPLVLIPLRGIEIPPPD